MSRPDTVYLDGIHFFTGVVNRLRPSDWLRPSPCAGWRALDVLGHVGTAARFGTALLRGEQPTWAPTERPGDEVGADPSSWWSSLAAPAQQALQSVDLTQVVDSPVGRRTVGEGLSFPALDLFVHAWDVGRSADIDIEIPQGAIEFAHATIDPLPADQVRRPGVFAEPVEVPPGATATQSFIAWTGRDPSWSPAG